MTRIVRFILSHDEPETAPAILSGIDDGTRWNGAAAPLVTLDQVRAYWRDLALTDRNSTGPRAEDVTATADALTFPYEDGEAETLPAAEVRDGVTLYRWDGWLWVRLADAYAWR